MASSQKSATSGTGRRRARSAQRPDLTGSEEPRIFTPPLRKLTPKTSLGFECIQFAESTLEMRLMPWQKWFLIHALELHPTEVDEHGEPTFRFRKIIFLVGRQNGKSTVMQALTLWRMFVDRCSLVIGTAQDLEVAESLWGESLDLAIETDVLKVEIENGGKVERQPGRKMFRLSSGETYKVKAATRRGGRGLSGELVLLDELREHQSWDAWGAVTKTTNAKSRAQIYGVSNAGDATSIVLRYLRKMAHQALGDPDGINRDEAPEDIVEDDLDEEATDDSGLGIFEWSAPPGSAVTDRDAWVAANPSLGHMMRPSTLASDSQTDPEWVFRTECMCQWSDSTMEGPFPPGSWEAGTDPESARADGAEVVAAVDLSHDRSRACVTVASTRPDGKPHVEVVASRAGSEWLVPWFTDPTRPARKTWRVALQGRGAPISSERDALVEAGLDVVEVTGSDVPSACGQFYDAVRGLNEDGSTAPQVFHRPQERLDLAAATATTRPSGDGWMWDRRNSPIDPCPLVAASFALWLLSRPESSTTSAYADHDLLII